MNDLTFDRNSRVRDSVALVHRPPFVISEDNMQHGRHWRGQDVRGWLASEKLDGCCGYWHHERMWSRSGRSFEIPPAWRGKLPPMDLVGEIYAGRGNFKLTVDAVARGQWHPSVCFIIYDAPKVAGTWEERMAEVARQVRCGFAGPVPYQQIEDVKHLAKMFRAVGTDGGEGLMLRCPVSPYRAGRSNAVLKLCRDPLTGYVPPGRLVVEKRMERVRRAA